MDLIQKLKDVGSFDALARLPIVERLTSLVEAGEKIYEQIDRTLDEGKDVLDAKTIEELRPLLDRIVPRAIESGRKLDDKLERAKNR